MTWRRWTRVALAGAYIGFTTAVSAAAIATTVLAWLTARRNRGGTHR